MALVGALSQRVLPREVVKEGQELIVQVDKEERGNKGAALTTFISMAGRYLVLMPNNPRAGGISRRIEGEDRTDLREAMAQLEVPDAMGVIVRTAGVGRSPEDLQWDLDNLCKLWGTIVDAAQQRPAPFLIYQESNVIVRAIRDYLRQDIKEVLIDTPETHEEALQFVRKVVPQYESKITLYQDQPPLFNRFQIETQIETAFQREVNLPSGGSIVIDPTEALVSIDINSSRATKGADIEETALNTNLEAADEIARQLRLRDIGGLIVVDFIDMSPTKNQREVEQRMREALELDRARVQVSRISRFGLMELSRQRLRPSLGESSGSVCPRCNGLGTIRDINSFSLSMIRLIEEEAMKDGTTEIHAQMPVDVATYLLNEKRDIISQMEQRHGVRILVIANTSFETPKYELNRIKNDFKSKKASYELRSQETAPSEAERYLADTSAAQREEAAVPYAQPNAPHPTQKPEDASSALTRFSGWISSLFKNPNDDAASERPAKSSAASSTSSGNAEPRAESSNGGANGRTSQNRRPNNRRRRRNDRGDRSDNRAEGSGNNNQRSGRGRRPDRDDNRDNNRDQREGRDQRRSNPRNNTASQGNSTPAVSAETAEGNTLPSGNRASTDESGNRSGNSSRRRSDQRGSRNGRNRRRRDDQADNNGNTPRASDTGAATDASPSAALGSDFPVDDAPMAIGGFPAKNEQKTENESQEKSERVATEAVTESSLPKAQQPSTEASASVTEPNSPYLSGEGKASYAQERPASFGDDPVDQTSGAGPAAATATEAAAATKTVTDTAAEASTSDSEAPVKVDRRKERRKNRRASNDPRNRGKADTKSEKSSEAPTEPTATHEATVEATEAASSRPSASKKPVVEVAAANQATEKPTEISPAPSVEVTPSLEVADKKTEGV